MQAAVYEYGEMPPAFTGSVIARTDWNWMYEQVKELPSRFEQNVISQYVVRYQDKPIAANVSLRIMMKQIRRLKMPLCAISSDTMAASWGKEQCRKIWTNKRGNYVIRQHDTLFSRYIHIAKKVKEAGFTPIGAERKTMTRDQCQLYADQMLRESWWARQAKVAAARAREYIAVSLGFVSQTADPYCSRETLTEWVQAQKSNANFLQSNFIGHDNGVDDELEIISLEDAAISGVANPEIRRKEMMARIRGVKEAATESGWTANFVTWTAPSVYHRNAGRDWNGFDPRDTQRYLADQWKKARAEIKKCKLLMAGMRVTEPHNDATPHWHILVFTPKEHAAAVLGFMQKYATQHHQHELKGKDGIKPRFHVEHIDPAKGCAVAYIAKYISKSINSAHIGNDKDYELGSCFIKTAPKREKQKRRKKGDRKKISQVKVRAKVKSKNRWLKDETWNSAKAALAWASRWGCRQFQFFGTPPVTVWREMRRLSDPLADEQAEAIRISAGERGKKNASFRRFCQLMGGLCSSRKDQPIKVLSSTNTNSYGEPKSKTVGLSIVSTGWEIITRKQWVKLGSAVSAFWRAQPVQGASRAARTRVNNCKLSDDAVNEKFAAATQSRPAIVGYLDAVGCWIVEKVTDYFNQGDQQYAYY